MAGQGRAGQGVSLSLSFDVWGITTGTTHLHAHSLHAMEEIICPFNSFSDIRSSVKVVGVLGFSRCPFFSKPLFFQTVETLDRTAVLNGPFSC